MKRWAKTRFHLPYKVYNQETRLEFAVVSEVIWDGLVRNWGLESGLANVAGGMCRQLQVGGAQSRLFTKNPAATFSCEERASGLRKEE